MEDQFFLAFRSLWSLRSTAAKEHAKIQSDMSILTPNLTGSRILQDFTIWSNIETRP